MSVARLAAMRVAVSSRSLRGRAMAMARLSSVRVAVRGRRLRSAVAVAGLAAMRVTMVTVRVAMSGMRVSVCLLGLSVPVARSASVGMTVAHGVCEMRHRGRDN